MSDATLENVTCRRIRSIDPLRRSSSASQSRPAWVARVPARQPNDWLALGEEAAGARLVLGRGFRSEAVGELRRPLQDRREAHHGHELVQRHLATVDLLEEVDRLVDAPELGVVVLD